MTVTAKIHKKIILRQNLGINTVSILNINQMKLNIHIKVNKIRFTYCDDNDHLLLANLTIYDNPIIISKMYDDYPFEYIEVI